MEQVAKRNGQEDNLNLSSKSSLDITLAVPHKPAVTNLQKYLNVTNATVLWKSYNWNEEVDDSSNKSVPSSNDNIASPPPEESRPSTPNSSTTETKEIIEDVPLPLDSWLLGGPLGSKSALLIFRSSALAQATEFHVHRKPAYRLHITYKVLQAETKLLSKLLECHGFSEVQNTADYNLLWTGAHPKPGLLRAMAPYQRINHFPRSYELTRKDRMYKNVERMQHAKGLKHFDFIPQTFVMPAEYKELCTMHHRIKGPWIVKPVASSRGRGIFIVESPSQVPVEEQVVVAKYISNPLLVEGHKCDLRLYVAVTSFDPLLIYIYEEGLVRFATVKYDTTHQQLWNPCMHLCNYSINKYHSDYIKSEDPAAENVGHKWTLSALLRHLKSQGRDTSVLMGQVEDLVVKTILASANSIVTACKMFVPHVGNCFELFGFDLLIDDQLKPWLLEVNLSPSLGCDSPLDVRLKSAMLADLLTLVGIPAVDPVLRTTHISGYLKQNNSKSNNLLKIKLGSCRRVHSADGLSNTLPKKHQKSNNRLSSSTLALTPEENRMIRMAKAQFERRGGFVRIFPTADSWAKYAMYLDPVTGIPVAGSLSSTYNLVVPHNFNQILYMHLFPDVPISRIEKLTHIGSKANSLDRNSKQELSLNQRHTRYERKLSQGHRAALPPKKVLKESQSVELKKQVCDMMRGGKKLSQCQARKAFSQYLGCVLKRITSTESADQEGHVEIVLKFLEKAAAYLRTPFPIKNPSHKLAGKDRAAIVAKQLNDFIYLYNRETEAFGEIIDRPNNIPSKVFAEFLENTRESDLEEVLLMQTLQCMPPPKGMMNSPSFQGLLKCLPTVSGISCFRSPPHRVSKKAVKSSLS